MKLFFILLLSLIAHLSFSQTDKQRLIVLADMGNEPDEGQQMVYMIMYSNVFDIEGLIAVSGKYLHLANGWPEPDYLRSIVVSGQPDYGIQGAIQLLGRSF